MDSQNRRIVLYSHDGMGIGHVRRNLLIASALAGSMPQTSILLIAGVCEAGAFQMPANVDVLTVPSLCKDGDGTYRSRRLGVSLDRTIATRSETIRAAVEAFDPHVMIVDKVPRGVARELEPTLRRLRRDGRTKCVLGLRDILDEPVTVRREWARDNNEQAIAEFYDEVWVYGDRAVYDMAGEYGWSDATTARMRYAGYLDRPIGRVEAGSAEAARIRASLNLPEAGRLMLCCVGGGEDGAPLAEAFASATLPDGAVGVILSGPFMPADARQRLQACADANPQRVRVIDFLADPSPLVRVADRAVAMGGYNCVGELLCAGTPALVVPRVAPRHEQWVRAQRLAQLGLIDMLHPHVVSADVIGGWLANGAQYRDAREVLDFGGLARIPTFLNELLARPVNGGAHAADESRTNGHAVPELTHVASQMPAAAAAVRRAMAVTAPIPPVTA